MGSRTHAQLKQKLAIKEKLYQLCQEELDTPKAFGSFHLPGELILNQQIQSDMLVNIAPYTNILNGRQLV